MSMRGVDLDQVKSALSATGGREKAGVRGAAPIGASTTVAPIGDDTRFKKGDKPVAGFDKHPENIAENGGVMYKDLKQAVKIYLANGGSDKVIRKLDKRLNEDKEVVQVATFLRDTHHGKPKQEVDVTSGGDKVEGIKVVLVDGRKK